MMTAAEIEAALRCGMCSDARIAEKGCRVCTAHRAVIEAVRGMEKRLSAAHGEIASLRARVDTLTADVERLEAERGELEAANVRMAAILSCVAIALRGEPPELLTYGWADLAERAAAVVRERDDARADLDSLLDDAAAVVRIAEERDPLDDVLHAIAVMRDNGTKPGWWKR